MALKHLITESRIDGDFVPQGEQGAAACCMPCGFFMVATGLWMLFYGERVYFHSLMELSSAQKTYFEEGCDKMSRQGVLHLEDCDVKGRTKFTSDFPGLEEMEAFEVGIPETPEGVWFSVKVQQHSRRRNAKWVDVSDKAEATLFMGSVNVYSDKEVDVGTHPLSDTMLDLMPGRTVPVMSLLASNDDLITETWTDGWYVGTDNPVRATNFTPYNMQVKENTYYSSADPDSPGGDDVRIWFEVGDSKKVSVLAKETSDGTIDQWTLKDFGTSLGRIFEGSMSATSIFQKIDADVQGDVWSGRRWYTLLVWMGTWALVYPHRVFDCCKMCSEGNDRPKHPADDCSSFFRAFVVAIPPAITVIMTGYYSLRRPLVTMIGGVVFGLVCFLVASIEHFPDFYQLVRPLVPHSVGFAAGDRWAGRSRPTVGTEVTIVKDGDPRRGQKAFIFSDDKSPVPYVVQFGQPPYDLRYERYAEGEVELIEIDAVFEPISSEEAPLSQAPLQEPMLGRTNSPLLERASSMPVRRSRSMFHSMLLGVSIGMAVSVVAVIVLTFCQA